MHAVHCNAACRVLIQEEIQQLQSGTRRLREDLLAETHACEAGIRQSLRMQARVRSTLGVCATLVAHGSDRVLHIARMG